MHIRHILQREALWPLMVLLLACAVLLPGLWSFGFWEPHEIEVADNARAVSRSLSAADASQEPPAGRTRHPTATETFAGVGIAVFGTSELGARLPLALLGLLAAVATFGIGRRLATARAGLLASVVLLTMPLFILQSRQLLGDIGTVAGTAVLIYGLIGLAWPRRSRDEHRAWRYLLDLALVLAGLGLAVVLVDAGGQPIIGRLLTGVAVPLGAVGLGSLAAYFALRGDDRGRPSKPGRRWARAHLLTAGGAAAVLAVVALGILAVQVYDFHDPIPGDRQIFGYTPVPTGDWSSGIAGTWKVADDLEANVNSLFEQIAFGLFPWSALAPVALGFLALGARKGRHTWAGYVVFAWAFFAWIAATVLYRKVGPVIYPGLVPIAVGIGIWLDDFLETRQCADASRDDDRSMRTLYGMPLRLPLVALFVLLACVTLAKDLQAYPERFTGVHAPGVTVGYPKDSSLKVMFLVIAVLFGASLFLALWRRYGRKSMRGGVLGALAVANRWGVHAALGVALVFALFVTQVWTPALSRAYSSKHLFSVFQELRDEGDLLGVMGNAGSGPEYYAGADYRELKNRRELHEFLKSEQRVFALAPAGELCPLQRASTADLPYHVLDDSNERFLLLSNVLEEGETDQNPLATAILKSPPPAEVLGRPVSANFGDRVELVGVSMPEAIERGDSFEMTLVFRVLKPVGGTWKIFVHFDGGGLRFQGDHEPINGRCGTSYWQPGDYIVDTFRVEAGDVTFRKTSYRVWVGFFQGGGGNWKNLEVVSEKGGQVRSTGQADDNDRVYVGDIRLQ